MKLKLSDIPEEVIEYYNLRELATPDEYMYCKVTKGMYGLPQAGIIAQELLEKRYIKRQAHIHMPGYIDKALVRFNHEKATKIQNSPYPHVSPIMEPKYSTSKMKSTPPHYQKRTRNTSKR